MYTKQVDGMRYEEPRIKKKHITKLSRPFRIGFFIDRNIERFHKATRWALGTNRRRK